MRQVMLSMTSYRICAALVMSTVLLAHCTDPEPSRQELLVGSWNLLTTDTTLKAGEEDVLDRLDEVLQGVLDTLAIDTTAIDTAELDVASLVQNAIGLPLPDGGRLDLLADQTFKVKWTLLILARGTWQLSDDEQSLTLRSPSFGQDQVALLRTVNENFLDFSINQALNLGGLDSAVTTALGQPGSSIQAEVLFFTQRQVDPLVSF